MLGLGVMISSISRNSETVDAIRSSLGKAIEKVSIENNILVFEFADGTGMNVFDGGQSCCEIRCMSTDDDLSEFKGAILLDFELKYATSVTDECGVNEVQFLDVKTSLGVFQIANHNYHNGYYGGFCIVAENLYI